MNKKLEELNNKGVFNAQVAMLDLRLRVVLREEYDPKNLLVNLRSLKKITSKFSFAPNYKNGFWVPNDPISISTLNQVSDEILQSVNGLRK